MHWFIIYHISTKNLLGCTSDERSMRYDDSCPTRWIKAATSEWRWLIASAYGAGGLEGLQPPLSEKNSIIRAKLMYCSGKDTVKNILLFNILIYLSSSRIPQNGLHDILPVLYKVSYLHPGVEVIVLHTSFRAQMGTFYLSLHGFVF